MKRAFYLAFAILFSTVCVIAYQRLRAGVEYDLTSSYDWIYAPETAGLDSTLSPMFYAPGTAFYNINSEGSWKEDQAMIDWKEFFKGEVSDEVIRFYLFSNDGKKEFASILKDGRASKSYPIVNWSTPKMIEFKSFLQLALEVDKTVSERYVSWDYKAKKEVFVGELLIENLLGKYSSSTNPVMRLKWWFQVVKAKYYSSNKKSLISFMSETEPSIPKGANYYRALNYLGGVYHEMKNFPMANAQYCKAMAHCPQLRYDAIFSYHALNSSDFNFALNQISDPEEKIAMWALQGFYTDEKEAMKAIYALNPSSEMLDLLLTRSMNKLESTLWRSNGNGYREYIADVKVSTDKQLVAFVNQVNEEGKTRDRQTWNLAAAYLNALIGENAAAEKELVKVFQGGNEMERDQARILTLINEIMRLGNEDPNFTTLTDAAKARVFEARIYPNFNWLINQGPSYIYNQGHTPASTTRVGVSSTYNWAMRLLGMLYKNSVRGELAIPKNEFYHQSANILEMKKFMEEERSDFDNLLLQIYPIQMEDIELYEGLIQTYAGKLNSAKEHFGKSALSKEELLADPFVAGIQDCHDCDHANYRGRKWTRISTLNRMILLEQNLQINIDMYYSALSLGNAYYNLSFHGNSRVFYESKLIPEWDYAEDKFHSKILNSCSRAKDYYLLALQNAESDEQRAKCEYFIAKCDRNEFYNTSWSESEVDFLAWNGFKNLKSKYANTNFYQGVIRECGYFRTYLSKNGY